MWKLAHPWFPVHADHWCVHPTVRMPCFAATSDVDDKTEVELVRKCLKENFANKGLEHPDVAWQNVGFFLDAAGEWCAVLFDLSNVKETGSTDDSWVNGAWSDLTTELSNQSPTQLMFLSFKCKGSTAQRLWHAQTACLETHHMFLCGSIHWGWRMHQEISALTLQPNTPFWTSNGIWLLKNHHVGLLWRKECREKLTPLLKWRKVSQQANTADTQPLSLKNVVDVLRFRNESLGSFHSLDLVSECNCVRELKFAKLECFQMSEKASDEQAKTKFLWQNKKATNDMISDLFVSWQQRKKWKTKNFLEKHQSADGVHLQNLKAKFKTKMHSLQTQSQEQLSAQQARTRCQAQCENNAFHVNHHCAFSSQHWGSPFSVNHPRPGLLSFCFIFACFLCVFMPAALLHGATVGKSMLFWMTCALLYLWKFWWRYPWL